MKSNTKLRISLKPGILQNSNFIFAAAPNLELFKPFQGGSGGMPLGFDPKCSRGLKSTPGSPPDPRRFPGIQHRPETLPVALKAHPVAQDAVDGPGRTFEASGAIRGDAECRGSPRMLRIARGTLLRLWGAIRGDAGCRGSPGMPRIARGALLRPRGAIRGDAERRESLEMPRIALGALLKPWATFRGDAERRGSLGMPRWGALLRTWEPFGAALSAGGRRGMPQVARRRSKTAERLPATRSRIEAALFKP